MEFSISIPVDDDGYVLFWCPKKTSKLLTGTIQVIKLLTTSK